MKGKRRFEEIGINIEEEEKAKLFQPDVQEKKVDAFEKIISDFDEKKAIDQLVASAPNIQEADVGTLIGLVQTLERAALKNFQMRTKYSETPKRFMQSEVDLATAIKDMNEVTVVPKLYNKLVQLDFVRILYELLSHENTDIVIETVILINELLDPQTLLEDKSSIMLLETLKSKKVFEMVVKNLERLDESEEDAHGLFQALNIFENIMEIDLKTFLSLIASTKLISFLVSRLIIRGRKDESNRFYSAELLANFVNLTPELCKLLREKGIFVTITDIFKEFVTEKEEKLKEEETEFLQNLLHILTTIFVVDYENRKISSFLMSHLLTLMRDGRYKSSLAALNALCACMINSPENCEKFITEKGLKTSFHEFMKIRRHNILKKSMGNEISLEENDFLEQLAIVFIQCFMHLREVNYLRFVKKFIEKDNEKIDKLVELFDIYYSKLEEIDKGLAGNKRLNEFSKKKKYLFRYSKGGYISSLLAVLIAFLLSSKSKDIQERVLQVLSHYDMSLEDVKKVVEEFRDNIEGEDSENKPVAREILENLVQILVLSKE